MKAQHRVTSYDVAAAAGVSRTTVSFVLNNVPHQSIPESTRRAVLEAAEALGYTPSAAARTLRAGSSRLVLCIAPDWEPSALMDEGLGVLTDELRMTGYATVIAKSADDARSLDILWQTITPAAVVAMFDVSQAVRTQIAALHVPLVEAFFHSYGERQDVDELQVEAGRQQAAYAIERGATRLVYVAPPTAREEAAIHADRLRGVEEKAAACGIPAPHVLELTARGLLTAAEIAEITEGYRREQVTVCCYNDNMALAVITSMERSGIEVPRDVRVIGVDDLPLCELVAPSITSVRFDVHGHMKHVAARIRTALTGEVTDDVAARSFTSVIARESA